MKWFKMTPVYTTCERKDAEMKTAELGTELVDVPRARKKGRNHLLVVSGYIMSQCDGRMPEVCQTGLHFLEQQ